MDNGLRIGHTYDICNLRGIVTMAPESKDYFFLTRENGEPVFYRIIEPSANFVLKKINAKGLEGFVFFNKEIANKILERMEI